MRIRTSLAAGAVSVLLASLACAIDDNSAEVVVVVESPAPVVVRGERVVLQAYALRSAGADTLTNISFVWTTSDPTRATIVSGDSGRAELTGVNAGDVDVNARAVAFEQSTVGTFAMRVSNALEVDSVRPTAVQWGDKLRVYGVGVRNLFVADLGTALIPDTLAFQGDPQGLGVMEFWVPPPARTNQLFVLGPGVFFTVPETTTVDTVDLYEFNDTIPAVINLDGTPPYPTLPSVLFFNPALAFEEPDRAGGVSTIAYDWYRFLKTNVSQPLTFILRPQSVADSANLFTVFGDSITYNGFHSVVNPTWFVTSVGRHWCDKGVLDVDLRRPDSLIVALKRRPQYTPGRTTLDVLSFFSLPQRHSMTVVAGYLTSDPRLNPDRFEENDICIFADSNYNALPTQIHVNSATPATSVFNDSTLNIDNPHDIDWYKFHVTENLLTDSVMIRVRSRPFPPGLIDRSDIDLYVVRTNTPTSFAFLAQVSSPGSRDSTRLRLVTGDYYLAVFDYAGEASRYSLCISVRVACTPLVAVTEAEVTEAGVRAAARGPDRVRSDGRERAARAAAAAASGQSPFRRP